MVNTMARRTDGGVRFRPVGSRRSRTAPVYSPRGTGCPAIEQAVQAVQRQIPQRIAARLESLYPAGFELPESDSDVNARQQSGTNGHD